MNRSAGHRPGSLDGSNRIEPGRRPALPACAFVAPMCIQFWRSGLSMNPEDGVGNRVSLPSPRPSPQDWFLSRQPSSALRAPSPTPVGEGPPGEKRFAAPWPNVALGFRGSMREIIRGILPPRVRGGVRGNGAAPFHGNRLQTGIMAPRGDWWRNADLARFHQASPDGLWRQSVCLDGIARRVAVLRSVGCAQPSGAFFLRGWRSSRISRPLLPWLRRRGGCSNTVHRWSRRRSR
jgi:hypothetical protein